MAARSIARDHDEKRGQILLAAAKVFATEGYDRSSMTRLAEECGISKANIYHYYPSKEALLYDILDSHLRALRDTVLLGCKTNTAGCTENKQALTWLRIGAVFQCVMRCAVSHDKRCRIIKWHRIRNWDTAVSVENQLFTHTAPAARPDHTVAGLQVCNTFTNRFDDA